MSEPKKYEPTPPKPTDRFHGGSEEVAEWVKAAGLALDPENTRRVVIDLEVGQVAKVYIEKMATRQMLRIKPIDLRMADIQIVEKPDEEEQGGDATAVA